MQTERLRAENPSDLLRAAVLLRAGRLVAFPTETVYGLGADALSAAAVAGIFAAKGRPGWDPLIVHVDSLEAVDRIAVLQGTARRLAEQYWPGPLTLLLPRTAKVPDAVTAGRPLVGIRIPASSTTRELIRLAGVPVAAPSANRFGHTSPTTAEHVLADLDGRIDAVLDGGPTAIGVESTVVEVVGPHEVVVYRPGGLELSDLDATIWVHPYRETPGEGAPEALPSPGIGMRHYAPHARLVLVGDIGAAALSRPRSPIELSLVPAIDHAMEYGAVGVLLPDGWNRGAAQVIYRWGSWGDADMLARQLFAGLRALEESGVATIVCPLPEMDGLGAALRDRLTKAARPA